MNYECLILFLTFHFDFNFQSEDSLLELLQNLADIDITFQELKVIIIIFMISNGYFHVRVYLFIFVDSLIFDSCRRLI